MTPRVLRYLTGGRPLSRGQVQAELLPRILADYDRVPGRGTWAALERANGQFLGWLELRAPDNGATDQAELGYRLRAAAWGRGYATEGARALIDKGFADPGLRRIWAETMAVNTASRRVMEKTGLRLARTFHGDWAEPIAGAEHGEVEYELFSDDWARMNRTAAGESGSAGILPE